MAMQPDLNSPEMVLQRIDAIVEELLALRTTVRNMISDRSTKAESANEAASILDIVRDAPGHRVFQSAEDVRQYLNIERATWDN